MCPLAACEDHTKVNLGPDLSQAQRGQLAEIGGSATRILTDLPLKTRLEEFSFDLLQKEPVRTKQHPLPHSQVQIVKKEVEWTDSCEQAYQTMKRRLASRPVVHLPDLQRNFVLRTDASQLGPGAVLLQEHDGALRQQETYPGRERLRHRREGMPCCGLGRPEVRGVLVRSTLRTGNGPPTPPVPTQRQVDQRPADEMGHAASALPVQRPCHSW